MRTLADRAFDKGRLRRPTDFLPNGCGAGWTGALVPDEVAGVEFGRDCCDPHDLEYHIGGFWGLFGRKLRADWRLGRCIARRFQRAATRRRDPLEMVGLELAGHAVGTLYTVGVTLLGWTPLTWPWRQRPAPTAEALAAVGVALEELDG